MMGPSISLVSPSGGAWTPLALSPVLWWRSDSGITTGTGVSSWVDKVAGKNLAQATGANQPTYSSSDANFNNKPSLTFDGSNDSLVASIVNLTGTSLALYYVCRRISNTGTGSPRHMSILGSGQTNDYDNASSFLIWETTLAGGARTPIGAYRNGALSTVAHPGSGVTMGISARFDSVNETTRVNGSTGSGTASSGAFNTATLYLGCGFQASAQDNYINMAFAEILFFNADLSAPDDTLLRAYLSTRYGMSF